MPKERLSVTSYLVLGMLSVRGPSTSYELKRAVAHSVGYFWHFPHAQLYTEPRRLVRLGLLEQQSEHQGRRRQVFTITEDGRVALRAWLAEPTNEHFEIRYIAELKLFFNEAGEPGNIVRLASEQLAQHRERLAEYEDIQRRHGDNPDTAPRMLTLQLGMQLERAALRFWGALLTELQTSDSPARPATYLPALRRRLASRDD